MALSSQHARDTIQALIKNLALVIKGKEDKIDLVILALIAGGHILIEDIPGVGKTTLARALARSLDGTFGRIQFTPDLLPSDITGVNFYQQKEGTFLFKKGPVFANIVLADEINRASPRTQSALLEAMSEGQVTVDTQSFALPQPFIVLATQNPIEYHGVYPLPEAQLDRFMLQLDLGYPPLEIEKGLAIERTAEDPVAGLSPVISLARLTELRHAIDKITVEASVSEYLLSIVTATRSHPQLRLGVSTRGTLLYARIARARAMAQGRDFVIPEDVQELAVPVLSHRLLLQSKAQYGGLAPSHIIQEIIESQKVPR